MKLFFLIFYFLLFTNCSFDNKTGIWKNEKNTILNKDKKNKIFDGFKKISVIEKSFQENISTKDQFILDIPNPEINASWQDIFYTSNNNFKNFKFNNLNEIVFKSKKLSKYLVDTYKLFDDGNLIINDVKGNLIIFSVNENRKISEFNFYKKKFKKIKKKLNFIVEGHIIYVADNLGYTYAYNYKINEVVWAKNYKIPFNSNLKIFNNKIIISNQNNTLYILNKNSGELIKSIPTEEFFIENNFRNNLSVDNRGQLFFLNSFGTLHSIDLKLMQVVWFNNFNPSLNLTSSQYFEGSEIINTDKVIIISANKKTYLIDSTNGSIIKKFNLSYKIKPVILNNKVFILSDNNFLISINLNDGNILYSYDISKINDLNTSMLKKKIFKEMMVLNSEIFIFLSNSYALNFNITGTFKNLIKLQEKIKSNPISIQSSILYINKNNKLIMLN